MGKRNAGARVTRLAAFASMENVYENLLARVSGLRSERGNPVSIADSAS